MVEKQRFLPVKREFLRIFLQEIILKFQKIGSTLINFVDYAFQKSASGFGKKAS